MIDKSANSPTVNSFAESECAMIHVNFEVMSWLREHFNYKGVDKFVIKETVPGGSSVMELLRMLAGKYPVFGKKAFSVKQTVTFDYCSVSLNGTLITGLPGLDIELNDGDTIKLFPHIYGG